MLSPFSQTISVQKTRGSGQPVTGWGTPAPVLTQGEQPAERDGKDQSDIHVSDDSRRISLGADLVNQKPDVTDDWSSFKDYKPSFDDIPRPKKDVVLEPELQDLMDDLTRAKAVVRLAQVSYRQMLIKYRLAADIHDALVAWLSTYEDQGRWSARHHSILNLEKQIPSRDSIVTDLFAPKDFNGTINKITYRVLRLLAYVLYVALEDSDANLDGVKAFYDSTSPRAVGIVKELEELIQQHGEASSDDVVLKRRLRKARLRCRERM